MTGLVLPLSAEDNRPIKGAAGQLVSIVEHAGAFAHALNMHAKLTAGLRATQYHLMVLIAMCPDSSNAKGNAQRALEQVKALVAESEAGAKLPPVQEAGEQAIVDLIYSIQGEEVTTGEYVKALKAKFRVYAR